jgi:hypothetical protein
LRKLLVILSCILVAVSSVAPAAAASRHGATSATRRGARGVPDWNQRDTAVYVVSTLNLLRTSAGQPLTRVFTDRLHVRRYDVYADALISDLYFINLVKQDGTVVGTLAYRMGWQKPMAVSHPLGRMRIKLATSDVQNNFRVDRKVLMASFTSTLPSS